MEPLEVAQNGMISLPLGVLEHDLGITQNGVDRSFEFLPHICKKRPVMAIVFGAGGLRFRHSR